MGLLTWILVGLVAGFIAQLVLGGGVGMGLQSVVITTLLGVAGAIVGGFVSVAMGYGDVTGFNVRSLVIAVLGAVAVIVVFRAVTRRSWQTRTDMTALRFRGPHGELGMMSGTSMPGGIRSSKRYANEAAFHKDELRMIGCGWTTQRVRSITVDDSFIQRTFHRHAADQFDVRYTRPDWPDT